MTETCDVPKSYEAMRDVLIAIRYMCTKRMVFPIVTASIEQKNEYLVMTKMNFNVKPTNFFSALQDTNGKINCEWLMRAFSRTAIYFDLKPVVIERDTAYQALSTRFFDRTVPEFAYSRHYDIRGLSVLADFSKPRIYTLNGVNYNGVQIASQEAEEKCCGQASRDPAEGSQASL